MFAWIKTTANGPSSVSPLGHTTILYSRSGAPAHPPRRASTSSATLTRKAATQQQLKIAAAKGKFIGPIRSLDSAVTTAADAAQNQLSTITNIELLTAHGNRFSSLNLLAVGSAY